MKTKSSNKCLNDGVKNFLYIIITFIAYVIYCIDVSHSKYEIILKVLSSGVPIIINIILVSLLFKVNFIKENKKIYTNKRALISFTILYLMNISYNLYIFSSNSINYINLKEYLIKFLPKQILMFLIVIIIMKFTKCSIKNFKFKANAKEIFLVLLLSVVMFLCNLVVYGSNGINIYIISNGVTILMFNVIQGFFVPALIEEILFRGLLISGLKGFSINDESVNIIQSIIFAITHFFMYISMGWIGMLGMSNQALIGFLLGKIYLKTGSITICALCHVLINTLYSII